MFFKIPKINLFGKSLTMGNHPTKILRQKRYNKRRYNKKRYNKRLRQDFLNRLNQRFFAKRIDN